MFCRLYVHHFILFCLIGLTLAGCGGGDAGRTTAPVALAESAATGPGGPDAVPGLLESLPAVNELDGPTTRSASAGGSIVRSPVDFWFTSGGTDWDPVEERLRLFPLPGEIQWMIYEFEVGTEGAMPEMVLARAEFDGGADNNLYFALANYATSRWDVTGVETGLDLPWPHLYPEEPSSYVSLAGSVFLAVIAYNASSFFLYDTELYLNVPAMPPGYLIASDGEYYDYVEVRWPFVEDAEFYDIEYRSELADEYQLLATVPAEVVALQSFLHEADSPPGKGAEYDLGYYYRIRSVFPGGGKSPLPSPSDYGYRTAPVPQRFHAGYRCDTSEIPLIWDDVPGVTEYRVYRDGEFLDVTGDSYYNDSDITDLDEHEYYVRSSVFEGNSLPSETATGRLLGIESSSVVGGSPQPLRGSFDLEIVDGRPFGVCIDSSLKQVTYAYSTAEHPLGPGDWQTGTVVGGDGEPVGTYYSPQLVIADGMPMVLFIEDRDSTALKCAVASTATPSGPGDWTVYQLYSDFVDFLGLAATTVEGRPAAAAMITDANELIYFRATSDLPASNSDWGFTQANSGTISGPVDLCDVDGRPAVCYTADGQYLTYQHAASADPQDPGDWSSITLPGGPNSGDYYSMAVIDGRPAIAYRRGLSLEYYFATWTLPDDPGDWYTSMRSFSTPHGEFASLAEVDGKPVIATYLSDTEAVVLISATIAPYGTNRGPELWHLSTVDDADNNTGLGCALAVQNGLPVVMYSAEDAAVVDNDWRYARGF